MIYATVKLTIKDDAMFARYVEQAGAALAKYGGAPVAQSKAPAVLEGAAAAPSRAVVLSFPDEASARNWINDPDLADIHALRAGSGESEILLLA